MEVLNTDAEGRLVLADALAYAVPDAASPTQVIDIATLTGAARVALGTTHAALYATDDALAAALIAAGEASGDRVWRMPLADDYATALDSDVADLAHVATGPVAGLDHGGAVPARVRRRAAVGAPGHRRARAGRPRTTASCPRARPGSASGCCWKLSPADEPGASPRA